MALLALSCNLLSAHGQATEPAALKIQVQIDGSVIKVADLWQNAGAKAEMIIGPAPPPGRSIAIETGQLAYIARLYDVAWRPVSGVERTSVERTGRPLMRDEIMEPIRRGLLDAGASPNATVEIANFDPIMVPRSSFPLLSIDGIAYDLPAERFSANVTVSTEGMQTQRLHVTGQVAQMVTVVVATRRLLPGDVIGPDDVRATQVSQRRLAGAVASDITQVLGQAPKRTIIAGQPLGVSDIGPQVIVPKGATVTMVLNTPGLSMAAQGLALGSGGQEDVIQVMNPLSLAVVAARVTGPGTVVITPGSSPIAAPTRTTPRASEVAN